VTPAGADRDGAVLGSTDIDAFAAPDDVEGAAGSRVTVCLPAGMATSTRQARNDTTAVL